MQPISLTFLTDRNITVTILCMLFISVTNGVPGGSGMARAAGAMLPSVPEVFRVLDVRAIAHRDGLAAKVVFNQALDPKRHNSAHLQISTVPAAESDKNPTPLAGEWVGGEDSEVLYFFGLDPETKYRVTVLPTLIADSGQPLPRGLVQDITAPAMPPSVGFASSGSLLPLPVKMGLPVMAVNVPEVDIDFFRVKKGKLGSFFALYRHLPNQYVYNIERLQSTMELVYTGRFHLDIKANVRGVSHIPVQNLEPLDHPGLYLALMRGKGQYQIRYPVTYFTISDLGVHLRSYQGSLDFWVNDLQSGAPLAGADVYVLDKSGFRISDHHISDGRGHGSFVRPLKDSYLLVAEHGDSTSVVPLFTPALDLSGLQPTRNLREQEQNALFIFGPRDLYRPGEVVEFCGLLRDGDGKQVAGFPLEGQLYDPKGKLVHSFLWHGETGNYYQKSFPLDLDVPTGRYQLRVLLPGGEKVLYDFQVEDFLPERLRLDLGREPGVPPSPVLASQPLNIPVTGAYLYGAPASGNQLQASLSVHSAPHPFAGFEQFYFGPYNYTQFNRYRQLADRKLDASGQLNLNVDNIWRQTSGPLRVTVSASLQESGGRPVSRERIFHVLPKSEMLGLRPLFGNDTSERNSQAGFEVIRVAMDGKLRPGQVKARLIREERYYNWYYSEAAGWQSRFTKHEYPVLDRSLELSGTEPDLLQLPVSSGYYRVEISDAAIDGTEVAASASYSFYAGWQQQQNNDSGPDRIDISFDKESYRAGETITATLKAPSSGGDFRGHGYLLVEGDRPLWWRTIEMTAGQASFSIPISWDWQRHDLHVSAVLIQPGGDGKPIRRAIGLRHLVLDRAERGIGVEILTPEKIIPNSILTTRVKLSHLLPGSTGSTRLTLAAVDVGILNISRFKTPDPFHYFFGPRRYTVALYDLYQRIIQPREGGIAGLVFGGDGEDPVRGGEPPAAEVQIVSLFSGPVEVDAEGMAEVRFDIPDFNGELRLMALAFNDEQYGSGQKSVTVAAPVVAQLGLPRFLAAGDRSTLALDLKNLSGFEQQLRLQLTLADGLHFVEQDSAPLLSREFELTLQNEEKRSMFFPIEATEQFGKAGIRLHLGKMRARPDGEELDFIKKRSLGIRPAYPAEFVRSRIRVLPGQPLVLGGHDLQSLIPSTVQGYLAISRYPAINLAAHFSALRAYPYGCLEQTTSGVYPQLMVTSKLLQQLGIKGSGPEERKEAIDKAIRRLATMQNSRGGFGLWSNQSPEEPWLSAYVTDFLLRARDGGYSVPDRMLSAAVERLKRYVQASTDLSEVSYLPEVLSVRAYSALVLARLGLAPLGTLRTLPERYGREQDESKTSDFNGLAWLQVGLALELMGDDRQAEPVLARGLEGLSRPSLYYHSYGSRLRDLALGLYLLADSNRHHDRLQSLAMLLEEELQGRHSFSTQERNALFLAGASLLSASEPWQAELQLGERIETIVADTSAHRRFGYHELAEGLQLSSGEPDGLFTVMDLHGYPRTAPVPSSDKLKITRSYYSLDGSPLELKDGLDLASGDIIICRLTVEAKESQHNLLAVNLLPAGLELENQNLVNSVRADKLLIDGKSLEKYLERLQLDHQEFRDDRYIAAFDLDYGGRAELFFPVRAVTPGIYRIPPPLVEAMYRPELRAVGDTEEGLTVRDGRIR